jgi:hypothetical protein
LAVLGLAGLWLCWVGLAIGLAMSVGNDASDNAQGSLACAVPGSDSTYGQSSWSWWPPGETCRFDGKVFRKPEAWRSEVSAGLMAGLVLLPAGTVVVARRARQLAPDDDPSELLQLDDLAR